MDDSDDSDDLYEESDDDDDESDTDTDSDSDVEDSEVVKKSSFCVTIKNIFFKQGCCGELFSLQVKQTKIYC